MWGYFAREAYAGYYGVEAGVTERRMAVFAGTLARAESLARELCLEQGFDAVLCKSKYGTDFRGYEFDVIFVDESALPLSVGEQNGLFGATAARHGVVYELRRHW